MKKILIAGCGGAPSEGVIKSLLLYGDKYEVIGMGSEPTDVVLSSAKRKYLVPFANEKKYSIELEKILKKEKPDLVHFQNDLEIYEASKIRNKILDLGSTIFMPKHEVIDICVNKYKSYLKWEESNIKVPQNILLNNKKDLDDAFRHLANSDGEIWLRASSIGGGGKGALPTNDIEFAKGWIDRYDGWGEFIGAEMLTSKTVTWLSIWFEGKLIVAQTRIRKGWVHGNRTLSGVTGVTKIGQTYSDELVTDVAIKSIKAIDKKPHGIFGVDMAYDFEGYPNPTEINISRFFTTILFFTNAGLNMPGIFADIALNNKLPNLEKNINPLPDNLLWLRGMDTEPRLINSNELNQEIIKL